MRASLFVLAVVGVLFCPFFRPLLDYHDVERQLVRMHMYFGFVNTDDLYLHQSPHTHFHAGNTLGVSPGGATDSHKAPDGTVSLTSHNAVAQGFFYLSFSSDGIAADFLTLNNAPYSPTPPRDKVFIEDAFLAPLKKPPRV